MISQSSLHIINIRNIFFTVLATAAVLIFYLHFSGSDQVLKQRAWQAVQTAAKSVTDEVPYNASWEFKRDSKHLSFNTQQCHTFFPDLYADLDRAVTARKGRIITVQELEKVKPSNGYIRAMIYDQQLYVIDTEGSTYTRGLATLLAIHRAIITSPEPVPDIEFTFSVADHDTPSAHWGLTRKVNDDTTWLMPDFAFWSWPETKVGSYHEVQDKTIRMETTSDNPTGKPWSWAYKIPKVFYRGATLGISWREKLIRVARDKPWADVKSLDWADKGSMSNDLKTMDEHCQYKYLVNTAGRSYSGRLKFIQNCRSVILMHDMEWLTHHTHLMKSDGPEQNYVQVQRDFSDLEETVLALQGNDTEAERIANNNVQTFRERYLTPAAEVCYWRQLFQSWSMVSFEPELWEDGPGGKRWRGVAFESYALMQRLDWDPY